MNHSPPLSKKVSLSPNHRKQQHTTQGPATCKTSPLCPPKCISNCGKGKSPFPLTNQISNTLSFCKNTSPTNYSAPRNSPSQLTDPMVSQMKLLFHRHQKLNSKGQRPWIPLETRVFPSSKTRHHEESKTRPPPGRRGPASRSVRSPGLRSPAPGPR